MPVEVGSQGFASHSLSKAYGTLSVTGPSRRQAVNNNMAEKASRWLWLGSSLLRDPKYLMTPGYNTDDVSKYVQQMYVNLKPVHENYRNQQI